MNAGSVSVDVDSHPGIVLVHLTGSASSEAVRGWLTELAPIPAYREAVDVIFDVSAVDVSDISRDELRRIIHVLRDRADVGPRRVAYVVESQLRFGILRMFSTLAGMQVRRTRGVFRSLDDALSWLRDTPAEGLS